MTERVKFTHITRTIDPKSRIHYLDAIDEKFEFLTEHFEDLFTNYWINVGRQYIYGVGEFV